MTVRMILNNKEIEASKGSTVLETARNHGIDIPTLCFHEALGVYGVCRLCVVEVSGPFPKSIRISCAQEVREGLVVDTENAKVKKNRQFLFELLLARSPDSKELIELAARHGVYESRFYSGDTDDNCVRCGRCIRVCRERIGSYALCFAKRGFDRKVTTDFERLSEYCIGCGACTQVCPTGAILMKDENNQRTIYTKNVMVARFTLEACEACGRPYAPRKYLDYVKQNLYKTVQSAVTRDLCPACARRAGAENLTGVLTV